MSARTEALTDAAIDAHLDAILRASGSALRHYSMHKTICDMRAALRSAVAALSLPDPSAAPVVPQWLPIESAPADMTECVAVRWVDSEGEECRELDYTEDGCWMGWHDHAEHTEIIGGHGVSYTPPYIGWHPLPPAPQQGEQAGQEGVQG